MIIYLLQTNATALQELGGEGGEITLRSNNAYIQLDRLQLSPFFYPFPMLPIPSAFWDS